MQVGENVYLRTTPNRKCRGTTFQLTENGNYFCLPAGLRSTYTRTGPGTSATSYGGAARAAIAVTLRKRRSCCGEVGSRPRAGSFDLPRRKRPQWADFACTNDGAGSGGPS